MGDEEECVETGDRASLALVLHEKEALFLGLPAEMKLFDRVVHSSLGRALRCN